MSDITKLAVQNEICAVCKMDAKQKCGGCSKVHYCSREHQKFHWKCHSKNCCPCKLVEDPTIGRRYIATRRIEIDEIILREDKPLLTAPINSHITCLNCYVPLITANETKQCDNCGWYLCLKRTRHGAECELTLKLRKRKLSKEDYKMLWAPYDHDVINLILHLYTPSIVVMRALALRESYPKVYERLLMLEDHNVAEAKQALLRLARIDRYTIGKRVKQFLNIEDLDEAEIAKIIGVVKINSFWNSTSYCSFLFDKASYFEHSCRPNGSVHVDNETIIIQAVVAIPKGHPITISYGNDSSGTAKRRSILAESRFFSCCCERCKDPTEFGTMFNAVKCINEKCTGYMLPPTFLVSNEEQIPDFVCDKCKLTTPSSAIDVMTNDISTKFSKIDRASVMELKKFINDHTKLLHANHFLMFDAELDLSLMIGEGNYLLAASLEVLTDNLIICKELIYLLETLMPGQYLTRARLQYQVFLRISAIFLKQPSRNAIEFGKQVKESKEALTVASRLLRYQPCTAQRAREAVEEQLRELSFIEQQLSGVLQISTYNK